MRILLCVLLAVLIFPALCSATPDGEYIFTSSGGFRFASIDAVGPIIVEVLANGNATMDLVDSIDGSGASPNTAKRVWPSGDYGLSVFNLRNNIPRPFVTQGTSVDSLTVTLGTATEVVVTWTNVN